MIVIIRTQRPSPGLWRAVGGDLESGAASVIVIIRTRRPWRGR